MRRQDMLRPMRIVRPAANNMAHMAPRSKPPVAEAGLRLDFSLVKPGERVGIAVSGGADSVALLLAMAAANAAQKCALGVGLSVVHLHHGIRGAQADEDAAFVAALAERLGLPLHMRDEDVPARAAAEREGLEEAARNARYGYFRELIEGGELDVVATAHTLNDQAETVLMKLLRGAWMEGLSGIHPVVRVAPEGGRRDAARSGRIIRPMLGVDRSEVEAYLRGVGQSWREDATNADVAYTRNRVRHELMPLLRSFNPRAQETLAHVAALARDEEARWTREMERTLPLVVLPGTPVRGGGRSVSTSPQEAAVALELERLRGMDPALRRRVLRAAARQLGCSLGFEHTERLMAFCATAERAGAQAVPGAGRTGGKLELPDGLRAERTARELRLWRIGR